MKMNKIKIIIFGLLITQKLLSAPIPQFSSEKHMGVATCSSGVCHGKSVEDKSENVMMNEYRTWLQFDDHSGAYKTLLNAESKKIASKLGLKSAQSAKICLDCHADNVPASKRGRKFQISDGVGCEACHGGSENWLSEHKDKGATHSNNIKLGLYPSEKPLSRAKLCFSCHLGTADKFATHRIMGAGHPRLNIELEFFTQNQPAHYKVDADYEKRKGSIKSINMWVNGLVFKAREQLRLVQTKQFRQHGLFPELSFYECHSCHRTMSPSRWPVEKNSRTVTPGSVRLDDASLVMLISVLESLNNSQSSVLQKSLKSLHQASLKNIKSVREAAKLIQNQLDVLSKTLISKNFSTSQKKAMRKKLLLNTTKGYFRDYSSAEQVFFAVETLSIDLNEFKKYEKNLDKLFDAVDEDKYYPDQFQVVAKLFLKRL